MRAVFANIVNLDMNDPDAMARVMKQMQEREAKRSKDLTDLIKKTWKVCGLDTDAQFAILQSTRHDLGTL